MWPTSRLTSLLRIEHPIVQAPMSGATTPALVAAVSNAGGLGSLGAARLAPAEIREAIRDIRSRTDRPFNVNLLLPTPVRREPAKVEAMAARLAPYNQEVGAGPVPRPSPGASPFDAQLAVVLEERVPVFSFAFGRLAPETVRALRAQGTVVIGSATTVGEGEALVADGVDAVVAQGSEAGGHRGTFAVPFERGLVGTMALVPQMADALPVPVVASGAVMDARGIVAALALGASGVQMGTAFLACPESEVPPAYLRAVLESRDDATVVTRVLTGRHARAVANRLVTELAEGEVLDFPVQAMLTEPLRQAATRQGRTDLMTLLAGQAARLARPRPAAELMADLVDGTHRLMASMRA